jgi:hypothetical protein
LQRDLSCGTCCIYILSFVRDVNQQWITDGRGEGEEKVINRRREEGNKDEKEKETVIKMG